MIFTSQMPPYPRSNDLVRESRKMTDPYQAWFDALVQRLGWMPIASGRLRVEDAAGLLTTPLAEFDNAGGIYQIAYALRVIQAATTSSGISLTVSWIENGVTRTHTSANLVANTTAQYAAESFLVQTDPNTPITVDATYVSVGATPMRYRATVYAIRMPQ